MIVDELNQSDAMSYLLFKISFKGPIRRSGVQRNSTIVTWSHMLLGFTVDIDLIGIDRKAVEEAYATLKRKAVRIGLTTNSTKTKYMITGRDRGRPREKATVDFLRIA